MTKRSTSPTERTLKLLRAEGWTAAVTERWNPHARVRQDLFGFADLLAIRVGETLAVQTCAAASHAARWDKILSEPRAALWLAAGNGIELISWARQGPRGKVKHWTPRRERIHAAYFPRDDNSENLQVPVASARNV